MLPLQISTLNVHSNVHSNLGASSAFFIKLFTDSIIAIAKEINPHNDGVGNDVVENTTTTIASTSSSQSSKIKKTTQTTLITAEHILQCMSKDSENGNKYDFIRDVVTSIVTTEEGSLKPTKVRERKSNENNYSDSTEITNKSSNRKKSTKNEITAQLIVQVPNYSQLQNKKGNADDNRTTNTSRKQKRKSNTAKDFKQKKSKVTKDIGLGQYLNSNELSEEQIDKINDASDKFYDDEEIIEDEEEYD